MLPLDVLAEKPTENKLELVCYFSVLKNVADVLSKLVV